MAYCLSVTTISRWYTSTISSFFGKVYLFICLFIYLFGFFTVDLSVAAMAQWDQMKLLVQQLQSQTLNDLYPGSFPMDVRHYLANWIEDQPWYGLYLIDLYDYKRPEGLFGEICRELFEVYYALCTNVHPILYIVCST